MDSVITQIHILCDICLLCNIPRMFTGDLKNRRHVDKFCREAGTELFPQLFAKPFYPACKTDGTILRLLFVQIRI